MSAAAFYVASKTRRVSPTAAMICFLGLPTAPAGSNGDVTVSRRQGTVADNYYFMAANVTMYSYAMTNTSCLHTYLDSIRTAVT